MFSSTIFKEWLSGEGVLARAGGSFAGINFTRGAFAPCAQGVAGLRGVLNSGLGLNAGCPDGVELAAGLGS
jgi:hypothetical protein